MKHDPTPEFLEHLEWQTERALRRRDRFSRPVSTGVPRIARTLALVLVCTLSGAGMVIGAERIQQSRQQELLLERNRIELALADRQLDRAVQHLGRVEMGAENGRVTGPSVNRARQEVLSTERHRQHLGLEREEIEASGRAPDFEITAPLVGGRDFRSEYLRLELEVLQGEVDEAQNLAERAEILAAAGRVGGTELDRARQGQRRSELGLQRVRDQLKLRADFVVGRLDAREALYRDRVGGVESRKVAAAAEIELLEGEVRRAALRLEAGVIGADEVSDLEIELEGHRAELELAELELELLAR